LSDKIKILGNRENKNPHSFKYLYKKITVYNEELYENKIFKPMQERKIDSAFNAAFNFI
jgi:hypothetical protein